MAKRELSSTLKNLKFMQRAVQREEKPKKVEEEEKQVIPDGHFSSPVTQIRKCVVIMEGNPHPGAIKGRMSFQSFNPSIDKLHEPAESPYQPKVSSTSTADAESPERENGSSCIGSEGSNESRPDSDFDGGDLKRKYMGSASGSQYPNKSPKNATGEGDQLSSPNNRNGSYKQKKREKLDFNLLRPQKAQNRRE